jgi:hypothetical protein
MRELLAKFREYIIWANQFRQAARVWEADTFRPQHRPLYRYGMLLFIIGLLAWLIHLDLTSPPSYYSDPYGPYIVPLMLLFIHLAYAFKWPRLVSIGLQTLAWSWIVVGLFYIFYLSRVLYPLPVWPASP